MTAEPGATEGHGAVGRALSRVVAVRPDELRSLLLSAAYFFFILSSYYVIRPLRDEMGVAGGVRNLPWLFTGTLVAMLLIHAPFAALVARLPRRRFVTLTFRFFLVNLLLFYGLLRLAPAEQRVWVGRAFFVWTSVFSLFVVSTFWAVLVDVFRAEQGKRLFGFIGVGGTVGGLLGSWATATLAERLGPVQLLLLSALLLECAVQCVVQLIAPGAAAPGGPAPGPDPERPIGGNTLAGIAHVLRSPYLLGIALYMLLYTMGSTALYFHQARFAEAFADRAARTVFFARLDLAVNSLTTLTQLFLTGRIIAWLGVPLTLGLLPLLTAVGFVTLGLWPTLAVFVVFQVLRRAGEYAVGRPAREVLYTVVSREDKYKAKNFNDTLVYRVGDQAAAWSYDRLLVGVMGLGIAAISWVMVPLAGAWLAVALWLGRRQSALAGAPADGGGPAGEPRAAG
ncbi:MAG: NTP/NDP exchange transporter [Micromonosporaceae bacterium]